jgi:protocatechuate 3,4-dioxygenase beta subunit
MNLLTLVAFLFLQEPAKTPSQGGEVTGQVIQSSGAPAAGVRIAALAAAPLGAADTGAAILERLTQTDEAGRYRLENVLPGRYYITAVGSQRALDGTAACG